LAERGFHEPGEKPRRFYKLVTVRAGEAGFDVLLDGRSPHSSQGVALTAPTRALADLLAEEWATQADFIDLANMHLTRLAFTALEAIPKARAATAAQFADYAGSDLLCYFAETPRALADLQAEQWGPVLERVQLDLSLTFVRASGIRHQAQPEPTLRRVEAIALDAGDHVLTGMAYGAALFGSAILTLALWKGWIDAEAAHGLSRVDESFQEARWGIDEEAAVRTARLAVEAKRLEAWFRALSAG